MKKEKCIDICFCILLIVFSVYIRICFLPLETYDYRFFLENWFNTLKDNGGIFGLKMTIGNYNLPYLQIIALLTYLPFNSLISIKVVSIIFDYVCAIFCALLIFQIVPKKKLSIMMFFITIMLPTVLLNSSAWGQCDIIYTSFVILSLLFLVKDKYVKSFIFLGIAFAFKLQTIFVLPVYILYYTSQRKFPLYLFLIIPLIDLVLCLPSMLVGKPIIEVIKVYILQAGENSDYISLEFPGIYNLFYGGYNGVLLNHNKFVLIIGIIVVGLIYFALELLVILKKIKFSKKMLIELTVWSVMICTYLLPKMHDRYMFIADILSVVCFLIDDEKWYLPIGVNICSLSMYVSLFNIIKNNLTMKFVAIFLGVILIKYTIDLFEELIGIKRLEEGDVIEK